MLVEQTAVIGREANRGITLVNRPAQIVNDRPVAGRAGREGIALALTAPNVTPHLVAQAVIVVALIPHRQQVAVFGIQDKQQPIEQNQGRVTHLGQRCVRGSFGNGPSQLGKYLFENQLGQISGHPFFVNAALIENALV